MYFKKIVKDYFTFSKKERIGLMSLLVLILTIFLLPYFLETRSKSSLVPLHSLAALLDSGSMETEELTFSANQTSAEQNTMVPEVFPFDPNTLTAEGWKRMGLPDGLARTIINYRNKGGKFKKAEDLQKIWGMQPADYHRIAPYVRIAENVTVYPREPFPVTEKKERPFLMVDVNHADSTLLEKLPGIGPKLSARIVA
ncbi:MAG: helix-hairpin-helix domain-containing protein, partial [Flavisolibacter sp.]|nr:helix-hairpin-helix domain-containing protein [Flavisolibacter sp.]